MNSDFVGQLIDIGIDLVIALIVWQYYKKSTHPPSDQYSTLAPRFWSGFVDSCVLWPLSFIVSGIILLNIPAILASVLICIQSVARLLYTVVLHARYGQTIGKMVTKVRVVDFRTEDTISWRQAWFREGIPAFLGLGLLIYQVVGILTGRINPAKITNSEASTWDSSFWLLAALPILWFMAEVLTMLITANGEHCTISLRVRL